MAAHSSILAWKFPWMEEPGRLQSMGSLRVGHGWMTSLSLFTFMHWRRKWQPTPVLLPGGSQGWGSLVDCCLLGCTESDMTEALSSSSVYMLTTISKVVPLPFALGNHSCLFVFLDLWHYFCFVSMFICTSFFFFKTWHISDNTYLSLSDLLHSVWQFLGLSLLLQMTFHFFMTE